MTPTGNMECLWINKTILGVFIKDAINKEPEINYVLGAYV
jgi:hypothetical protein